MIKRITKKVFKEVMEVESEVIVCNICGKEINYDEKSLTGPVGRYYQIKTGHHDWGNDSCESVEYTDACCDECLSKFTQKWLKDEDVIRSNTAYIEIYKKSHLRKGQKEDKTV